MPNAASRCRKPNPLAMFSGAGFAADWGTGKGRGGPTGRRRAPDRRCREPGDRSRAAAASASGRRRSRSPLARRPRLRSADRRSVDQAALGPEIVVTAFKLERRPQAEMLIEDLAVIADRL